MYNSNTSAKRSKTDLFCSLKEKGGKQRTVLYNCIGRNRQPKFLTVETEFKELHTPAGCIEIKYFCQLHTSLFCFG